MKLSTFEMEDWRSGGEEIQLSICRNKVMRRDVRMCLLSTGEAYLLHQDNRAKADTPWGGKIPNQKLKLAAGTPIVQADVIGENKLGLTWMRVRQECRDSAEPP